MTDEAFVRDAARRAGFPLVGIADATPHERTNRVFRRWLAGGRHAGMAWLERHRERREDPRSLLPEARSVVCVAVDYWHPLERDQRDRTPADGRPTFSIYVHHEDYHRVMDRMLRRLETRLRERWPSLRSLRCVDTRAISDRAMALRAGIGWLGKNTAVISPSRGSWIFLGELLVDVPLQPDAPLETLCGRCTRCIDACPTGALDTPFVLDARRCISYLTIEHRGEIPEELARRIGVRVYGCDTCQSVCPFNDVAVESTVFDRAARSPLVDWPLERLAAIDDETFREHTRRSAIRRCRAEGMRRNARIVARNIAEARAARDQSAGR